LQVNIYLTMAQNSNNGSDSPKSISKVVGQHADRVMDGLFSEIEELLSGDLQEQQPAKFQRATPAPQQLESAQPAMSPHAAEQQVAGNRPPVAAGAALPPGGQSTAQPAPARRRGLKGWVVGGGSALLVGGGLWWLQSQGKIDLTALGRGESPIAFSNNADVKFSEYLRGSLTKIDSNNPNLASTGTPAAQGVSSSTAPSSSQGAIAIPNPPTAATGTASAAIDATLVKIVPGNPPMVEFSIGGQVQQFKGGDQIANSGWILTNVINTVDNEVILKRNGESRSLKLNDKL
jgi:hypothetical protein